MANRTWTLENLMLADDHVGHVAKNPNYYWIESSIIPLNHDFHRSGGSRYAVASLGQSGDIIADNWKRLRSIKS